MLAESRMQLDRSAALLLCSTVLTALGSSMALAETTTSTTETKQQKPSETKPQSVKVIAHDKNDAEQVIVTAHLDRMRSELSPSTGATVHKFSRQALETIPGADNAPLNQVLLQAPGVAQDSYGQIDPDGSPQNNSFHPRHQAVQLLLQYHLSE